MKSVDNNKRLVFMVIRRSALTPIDNCEQVKYFSYIPVFPFGQKSKLQKSENADVRKEASS
jgi:hypothetical protein